MPFDDLFFWLIPYFLIQMMFSIYYLRNNFKSTIRTPFAKFMNAFGIILIGFPFMAYTDYLDQKEKNIEIHPLNDTTLFYIIIFSYQVFSIQNIINNQNQSYGLLIVILSVILYGLLFISRFFAIKNKTQIFFLFSLTMLALSIIIEQLVFEYNTQLLIINVLSLMMLYISKKYIKIFLISSSFLILSTNIIKSYRISGSDFYLESFSIFLVNLFAAILVFFIFYGFRRQILLNDLLQNQNEVLKNQQKEIERLSIQAERLRISHEIHDSIGHHLTAAYITLEKMIENDDQDSSFELDSVKKQIRLSLNEVRTLVHNMNQDLDIPLKDQLSNILNDLIKGHPIKYHLEIETEDTLPSIYQRFLINIVKEFSTNSLKHGSAKTIDILLTLNKEMYLLILSDDGIGTDNPKLGFGLTGIFETCNRFGGIAEIKSKSNQGFTLIVKLPIPQNT